MTDGNDEMMDTPAKGHDEDDDFFNEEDVADEDWESYDEEYSEEDSTDAAPSTRNKNFNNIVIGIAVVVALGVGGFTMFGGSGKTPPPPAPQIAAASSAAPVSLDSAPSGESSKTADLSSDVYRSTEKNSLDETLQAPEKPQQGLLHSPSLIKRIQENTLPSLEDDMDLSTDDDETSLPMPEVIVQKQEELDAPLTPLPVPSLPRDSGMISGTQSQAAPAEQEEALKKVNQRLDSIFDNLKTIELALSDIDDLRKEFDSLDRRIDKIEKTAQSSSASLPRTPLSEPVTAKRESASSSKSDDVKPQQSSGIASDIWILKSAQPGEAMVAKSKGGGILSIKTGDTLPGIGRIISIGMQDNKWVVQGEKGTIEQ